MPPSLVRPRVAEVKDVALPFGDGGTQILVMSPGRREVLHLPDTPMETRGREGGSRDDHSADSSSDGLNGSFSLGAATLDEALLVLDDMLGQKAKGGRSVSHVSHTRHQGEHAIASKPTDIILASATANSLPDTPDSPVMPNVTPREKRFENPKRDSDASSVRSAASNKSKVSRAGSRVAQQFAALKKERDSKWVPKEVMDHYRFPDMQPFFACQWLGAIKRLFRPEKPPPTSPLRHMVK